MRCLALAEALRERGVELSFVCREHEGNLFRLIESSGYQLLGLPKPSSYQEGVQVHSSWLGAAQDEDVEQTCSGWGDERRVDWLIVDHYGIDQKWERAARRIAKRVLVIDDLANRAHDCDVLLDQNLRDDMPYQDLVPQAARQLIGPRFALLRGEFRVARENLSQRDGSVRRLLIFFGGVDADGETIKAIDALAGVDLTGISVDVIVGGSNPKQALIAEKCREAGLNYHCQVSDMARFLANADLGLGAGGVSSWERLALGVPTLVIAVADNQMENMRQLEKHGVARALGAAASVSPQHISAALGALLNQPEALRAMSQKALTMVDANGAARVVEEMMASEDENGR